MEKPTIGIKVADGSYFPILEEGSAKRKRLVLTTVNDDQESVQIDLYKGEGSELLDAAYVGSLLIENITQGPKESSEIELKIGFGEDGILNAEAGDPATGQIESLSVSMESLGESAKYDIPEFSLDDESEDLNIDDLDLDSEELSLDDEDLDFGDIPEEETMAPELGEGDFDNIPEEEPFESVSELVIDEDTEADDIFQVDSLDEYLEEEPLVPEFVESEMVPDDSVPELAEGVEDEDDFVPGFLPESEVIQPRDKKSGNPILIALLVIIAIAAIAGISYLIFRSLQGEDAPGLEAKAGTEEPAPEAPAETPVVPAPEVQPEGQDAAAVETAPPVESTKEEPQTDETTTVPALTAQESNKIVDTTGVWYRIRWGDTLWGISYSFYDSPRDYKQIVKENSIANPDIIFAETEIFIPSK